MVLLNPQQPRHPRQVPVPVYLRSDTAGDSSSSGSVRTAARGTNRKSWNERYHELRQYRIQQGDVNCPERCKENKKLGRW
mmetsp:Transcript_28965/g.32556  ORF Transcript_28965/g.32556 Transcript_28965/m.32556 type:complete len:80 (-) Transcript_28965:30-269(-)